MNENVGGIATTHRHLAASLAARPGLDVTVADVPPPGLVRRLVRLPVPGLARRDLDFQPLRNQLAQSAVAHRMVRARRGAFDVVHFYSQHCALLSTGIVRRSASVVTLDSTGLQNASTLPYRDPTRFTRVSARPGAALERQLFSGATLLVAQSDYAARSLRADYGVAVDRIRIVRLGIELPAGPLGDPGAGPPRICFVGTSLARKGGHRLMEVYRRHLADRATLTMVTPEPVAAAAGIEVVDDIRPGSGRVYDVLRRGAVFAFPSEIDKSPNVVLEAMAAGLPVVAARVGALDELVEDGVTGFLVPPADDAALLAALRRLLDDPERRRAMGAAGRARAEAMFDARRTGARLAAVMTEAFERHQSAP